MRIAHSSIQGKGVFAAVHIGYHSEIARFDGDEVSHDTPYSLTLDGKKIEPTGELKYLNHSCDPNAYFRGRTLVARRHIQLGEEITINYLETEKSLTHQFECKCKAPNCIRKLEVTSRP